MNSLNLRQIDGGNIIKQADSGSLFKFELLDENHKKFEEQLSDTATVILKQGTVAVFKKIVAVTDNCVAFNLDKILEVGDYILEIIVGSYVFPSNNRLKISVESTYGDYQPENLVRITYEEIDEKINELKDRLDDLNVAGQTEMLMRIEKLESKEDSDTIYDDSELVSRITALENKPDKDTIYDDAQLKEEISETKSKVNSLSKKVSSLEQKEDHDTIYDDSEIKRRITALEQKQDNDTIYNDTEIKQSIVDVDTKVDNLSEKVTTLEERPTVDTALTKRVEVLERKEDRDTFYDDSNLKAQITELQEKLKSLNNTVKRPPYGYRLNRKAEPWELIFDNGCILTFPLDTNHEYYGWDEIPIKISNTRPYNASPYSTPEMIMWYVKGHRTVEYLKTSNVSSYTEYINYELKNPINDSSLYNFDNAFGDASDDTLIGKRNFVKLLYELDALIEDDLISVGVIKNEDR